MAEQKTKPTPASVTEFLEAIPDEQRRKDCFTILKIMERATRSKAIMWGSSMVGFGSYHYKYASGHEGTCFEIGFSPRKTDLTLYLGGGLHRQGDSLKRLGKHKAGKGCLYIKRLTDVDVAVLTEMISGSLVDLKQTIEQMKQAGRAKAARK